MQCHTGLNSKLRNDSWQPQILLITTMRQHQGTTPLYTIVLFNHIYVTLAPQVQFFDKSKSHETIAK
jgi:hypothetical protein